MMIAYIKLIRFSNLLIVAFTQYLLEFFILIPALSIAGINPILDSPRFILLVISTMLIAAGGYVINDIEDVEIDRINKPEKQIVSRLITVRQAWIYYYALFFVGLLISLYLALYIDNLPLLSLYPAAWLLLYLYSRYFKKMALIGNVTVAFFCAFVAGIVWFAERYAYSELFEVLPAAGKSVTELFSIYIFFAFISTLYREIIKDIEDYEGDAQNDCKTLPIIAGLKVAKSTSIALGLVFLGALFYLIFYVNINQQDPIVALSFIIIAMLLPLAYSLILLVKSATKKDYKLLSRFAKFLMLTGILLLFFL